jgi:hypothetical protein
MTFGRIVRNLHGEACSIISPKWLTAIFVVSDVICLASQLAGSVLRASDDPTTNQRGAHIVLAGLILQVSIFCLFAILALNFHLRFRKMNCLEVHWGRHMAVLYFLSGVFVVRNLVRIIEFLQGGDGYIVTHESMLYVFDGTFMLLVAGLLVFVHPGRLFRDARRVEKITIGEYPHELTPFAGAP